MQSKVVSRLKLTRACRLSEGTIGEVLQIASQKSYKLGNRAPWFRKTSTYGGSITWVGIHMLDLMRWTSGREFTSVAGFETRWVELSVLLEK